MWGLFEYKVIRTDEWMYQYVKCWRFERAIVFYKNMRGRHNGRKMEYVNKIGYERKAVA